METVNPVVLHKRVLRRNGASPCVGAIPTQNWALPALEVPASGCSRGKGEPGQNSGRSCSPPCESLAMHVIQISAFLLLTRKAFWTWGSSQKFQCPMSRLSFHDRLLGGNQKPEHHGEGVGRFNMKGSRLDLQRLVGGGERKWSEE